LNKLLFVCLLVCLLSSCTQAQNIAAPTVIQTPAIQRSTTNATTSISPAEQLLKAQNDALLYSQDFENGNADGIGNYGPVQNWTIENENGNHIYCNNVLGGVSELIGTDHLTNFAIELKVKPVEISDDSYISVMARDNRSTSQTYYGALNFSTHYADLNVSDPFQGFGRLLVPTQLNTWYKLRLEAAGNKLSFYVDDKLISSATDDNLTQGKAGFAIVDKMKVCIDDIRIWELTDEGQIAKKPAIKESVPSLQTRLESHQYPKLFLEIQDNDPSAEILTQSYYWDLSTFPVEIEKTEKAYLGPNGWIRSQNPNSVLLGGFSVQEYVPDENSAVGTPFVANLEPAWTMHDTSGKPFNIFYYSNSNYWSKMLNLSSSVNTFLPQYLNQTVMSTGLFDGIYYDGIDEDWSWLVNCQCDRPNGPIDINNDKIPDTATQVNQAIDEGTVKLLTETRTLFPDPSIITGNAGGGGLLLKYGATEDTILENLLNGRMLEGFLTSDISGTNWLQNMRNYYLMQKASADPKTPLLLAYCTGTDYSNLRYALSSSLMFDGYFGCTNNQNHGDSYTATWWYDEYAVNLNTGRAEKSLTAKGYLGKPTSEAYNPISGKPLSQFLANNNYSASQMVWRRDFQNGIVLVNPSEVSQIVDLKGTYKKINGLQDQKFNDGSELTKITLPAKSGAILLNTH
jgi:hypothetical protein